jgi:hypothetical protein
MKQKELQALTLVITAKNKINVIENNTNGLAAGQIGKNRPF